MPLDQRSETNLSGLSPQTALLARSFAHVAADKSIIIQIISGYRSPEEQNALWAKGRLKPGKKVTNAKAGYSAHNFRIAFDIGIFHDGNYLPESPLYRVLGPVGESLGLRWGGRWEKFQDEPHYYLVPSWLHYTTESEFLAALRKDPDLVD